MTDLPSIAARGFTALNYFSTAILLALVMFFIGVHAGARLIDVHHQRQCTKAGAMVIEDTAFTCEVKK